MRIGIIGAGFIGRALATLATAHGHQVMVSNSRGPETLSSTIASIGCAAGTADDAATFGEIVVIAVPFRNYRSVPAAPLGGKVVIDTCNYYPQRDGQIEALDTFATTTTELIAAHLPGAKVVKAFNAILERDINTTARPAGTPGRRALPVAGNDQDAKRLVVDLLDQWGFDAVDAGSLAESWRFERAKPAYCIPLDRDELSVKLAAAQRDVEMPHGSWRG